MLFNEPKLLKSNCVGTRKPPPARFSALQRAEIAEMFDDEARALALRARFSALQRAEIAEMTTKSATEMMIKLVSVLFNEPKLLKSPGCARCAALGEVSVLFNEPKLLKCCCRPASTSRNSCFSALQRAEIAEIVCPFSEQRCSREFQCSSTSRNC